MSDRYRDVVEAILALADVSINGNNPWDIAVHDPRFFRRIVTEGELGLGESYMDRWWDALQLDEFIHRILRADLDEKIPRSWSSQAKFALARILNLQSRRRAFIIGERHYDLGNELFVQMLDRRMNYSGAYWAKASTLDEAQEQKLELICGKLRLERGMRVLDIGCGWGAFGKYAAEIHGATVVGITVSRQQLELGRTMCKGLPVEFRLMDYRDLNGVFERIVSVGMIEHVGYKNYRDYFATANRCLADDGLFLLQTIGGNRSTVSLNPWTEKYIFPNSMLPSITQVGRAIEGLFIMEDWQSFGQDYDRTLMAWHRNFTLHWENLRHLYDDRFSRMWEYYLLSSAGAFRARRNQLWQIVLSKAGIPGGFARTQSGG